MLPLAFTSVGTLRVSMQRLTGYLVGAESEARPTLDAGDDLLLSMTDAVIAWPAAARSPRPAPRSVQRALLKHATRRHTGRSLAALYGKFQEQPVRHDRGKGGLRASVPKNDSRSQAEQRVQDHAKALEILRSSGVISSAEGEAMEARPPL